MSVRVLRYLLTSRIMDVPTERSSHENPVPRGGGWAIMWVVLPVLGIAGVVFGQSVEIAALLSGTAALMAISWMDDRYELPAFLRFAVHGAAVAVGLLALPQTDLVWQGILPWWADRAATLLLWLWFINLYNFMDGIDGLAGSETILIGTGLALVSVAVGGPNLSGVAGAALAGSAAGFLTHNWRPARMFMGDVGSIPLGYILGFLLISLSMRGHWVAAAILPAYYLADATITLSRRLLRGEKIWKAHREHFYQKAAMGARRHDRVVLTITRYNLGLLVLALASLVAGPPMLILGAIVIAALLHALVRMAKA